MCESLGADEVGFLELQPGDVVDLDDRIAAPAQMLARDGAVLAVQTLMSTNGFCHHAPIRQQLTKSSHTRLSSVKRFLTNSSTMRIAIFLGDHGEVEGHADDTRRATRG